MSFKLGITGGIGTGKSAVVADFKELGAAVLSADDVAREVMAAGSPVLAQLRKTFGPQVIAPNGGVNRGVLGQLIFADPAKRQQLNQIVQPLIRSKFEDELTQLAAQHAFVVCEVPLLFEEHYENLFDAVLVVEAPAGVQRERVMSRDGLTRVAAERRIASQMPLADKLERADYAINTDGPEQLRQIQVQQLMNHLAEN